ncbi:MAG: SDR family oxidoreductase [Arenicellales bacterium WSBS_2016_MAG_OTU3]
MLKKVFIVGFGYVGQRLAGRLLEQDINVTALIKNADRKTELSEFGVEPVVGDLDHSAKITSVDLSTSALCYFAPPPPTGVEDGRLGKFLHRVKIKPSRAILISTTGVYGDCGGEWVTESNTPKPSSDRARRRLHAEDVFVTWAKSHNVSYCIVRVPGIYGPGRLPLERLKKRIPLPPAENCSWTNRIHVDDLVGAIHRLLELEESRALYNISDSQPLKMTDYFNAVADLSGLPRPPIISWQEAEQTLGDGMLSYLRESRRIDGSRLIKDLQLELKYPDYKLGIKHSL